jgi:deazaflavin-dependent oxidoreductase (nitroreductase family)
VDPKAEKAVKSNQEIVVTSLGRKSKNEISTPLWFVPMGDKIFLLPMEGTHSNWYKNVESSPSIKIKIGDYEKQGVKPRVVKNKELIQTVLERFREKYTFAEVAKYYKVFDVTVEITP